MISVMVNLEKILWASNAEQEIGEHFDQQSGVQTVAL